MHADSQGAVYNGSQKPWQIAYMFAKYHTACNKLNTALVLGAGSGSKVIGCLAAGVSVVAFEHNLRQFEGLEKRVNIAMSDDTTLAKPIMDDFNCRPPFLLVPPDERDFLPCELRHFDPDVSNLAPKGLWDKVLESGQLPLPACAFVEQLKTSKACARCGKSVLAEEVGVCSRCTALFHKTCIDEDGFCGPGCRSGQLSQPAVVEVEDEEEELAADE